MVDQAHSVKVSSPSNKAGRELGVQYPARDAVIGLDDEPSVHHGLWMPEEAAHAIARVSHLQHARPVHAGEKVASRRAISLDLPNHEGVVCDPAEEVEVGDEGGGAVAVVDGRGKAADTGPAKTHKQNRITAAIKAEENIY